jgi:hypothetical protein
MSATAEPLDGNCGYLNASTVEVRAKLHWPTDVSSSRVNANCSNARPAISGCQQSTVTKPWNSVNIPLPPPVVARMLHTNFFQE